MGYDLTPAKKSAKGFHMGAYSFPVLLEACGYLWPCIQRGQWYCVFGVDPRMPVGDTYPRLISNDGFMVTDFEAKVMARCARNFVAIQRSLPEENRGGGIVTRSSEGITRDKLVELLEAEPSVDPWPTKIRDDFVDTFEKFSEWAEASGGFEIH